MVKAINIPPSENFREDGGTWSTFFLEVGTPSQEVEVIPATSGDSIWVVLGDPDVGGCTNQPYTDTECDNDRGHTFDIGSSGTFKWIVPRPSTSPLQFAPEGSLGGNYTDYATSTDGSSNSFVGRDSVVLGSSKLVNQVLQVYPAKVPYQGVLGLTDQLVNFTTPSGKVHFNSPLTTFREEGLIPSTSWAYTAGAYYKEPPSYGSLTFGGYDALRRDTDNSMTVPLAVANNRNLLVNIMGIEISGDGSTTQIAGLGVDAYIDSVVPQIYLPLEACKSFEAAFGLVWNEGTSLYMVDSAQHERLISQDANVTFSLGSATSDDPKASVKITLPYRAFDQTAQYPLVGEKDGPFTYFPLKRATDDDQITLGRTFLQEAYVTVDYDRYEFSVSQTLFPADAGHSVIKTVYPPGKPVLSTGAIVGIAVGAFVLLLLIIGGIFGRKWWKRRQSRKEWFTSSAPSDVTAVSDIHGYYGTREKVEEWERRKMELDATETARGSVATRQELESPPPQSPPMPYSPASGHSKHGSVDSQASELGGYFALRRTLSGGRPIELPATTEEERNREQFEVGSP